MCGIVKYHVYLDCRFCQTTAVFSRSYKSEKRCYIDPTMANRNEYLKSRSLRCKRGFDKVLSMVDDQKLGNAPCAACWQRFRQNPEGFG
jgi:hypothetical protein